MGMPLREADIPARRRRLCRIARVGTLQDPSRLPDSRLLHPPRRHVGMGDQEGRKKRSAGAQGRQQDATVRACRRS
jgi:hypothetical protein